MTDNLKAAADAVLARVTDGSPRVPGVAAVITDRNGNIYEGAAGERVLGGDAFTPDTVCAIFSTTKAITATALLQQVEQGQLDLDAPAKEYAPALAERHVLDGFDDDGQPVLRPPAREITTRHLLTHTAGFAYDFFNESYNRLATDHDQPSVITASHASINTPLLFDPGEQWEYGSNIDWAGQVLEGLTGKRLGEYLREHVLGPLGMDATSFVLDDDMRSRLADVHARGEDGSLTPMGFELPQPPDIDMGGHGLYGTVLDYAKFIRMWLNEGMGPDGPILAADTVAMATRNHLPGDMTIKALPAVIPALTNEAEFFPGMPKTWSLPFMINDEEAPTGRPAGAQAWAGLANLYYWIDIANGIGGYWATQILPFADPTSVVGFLDLETAAYDSLKTA